eukprot:2265319-Pyramimonas_sp.AAC.1
MQCQARPFSAMHDQTTPSMKPMPRNAKRHCPMSHATKPCQAMPRSTSQRRAQARNVEKCQARVTSAK